MDQFEDVYRYGKYFQPAGRAYGHQDDEVGCDRCQAIPLSACVSYRGIDICLQCMTDLDDYFNNDTEGDADY